MLAEVVTEIFEDMTYQVADHDLALASQASALGGCRLVCAASGLGALLDAAGGSGGSGPCGAGSATLRAATALLVLPLAGEDLIERLVELARHDCGREWKSVQVFLGWMAS